MTDGALLGVETESNKVSANRQSLNGFYGNDA